jgi:hypothetical protein
VKWRRRVKSSAWSLNAAERAELRALLEEPDDDALLAWYDRIGPPNWCAHVYVNLAHPTLRGTAGPRACARNAEGVGRWPLT